MMGIVWMEMAAKDDAAIVKQKYSIFRDNKKGIMIIEFNVENEYYNRLD